MWNQWQIDFYNVMYRLIGWIYRTPTMLALLRVLSQPMNYVNTEFVAFRNAIKYKLKFNAQIVYLELFLNNMFNIPYAPATRDADIASHTIIYITSVNIYPDYIWNKIENKQAVYVYNKSETPPAPKFYIGNLIEYNASNNFVINIPVAVAFNPLVVRAAVNTYNIATKTFTIQTY